MSTTETRNFPTESVLSITTGKLLCDMAGVYDILNWMTGQSLTTLALGSASDDAKPVLAEALPWTQTVQPPDFPAYPEAERPARIRAWVEQVNTEHGGSHPVPRLPEASNGDTQARNVNAITKLAADRVVYVTT